MTFQHLNSLLWVRYSLQSNSACQSCLTLFDPINYSSVQSLSCSDSFDPMDCSMPGRLSITNFQSSLKLMSLESVMPFNHLNLCCPPSPPTTIFPSIRVFSDELDLCIRWFASGGQSIGISASA